MEVNIQNDTSLLRDKINNLFNELRKSNPDMSLDDLLQETYKRLNINKSFVDIRAIILDANNIDEYEYYTKDVNPKLKKYVEDNVFPRYEANDKAHGIIHILEVIRRSFALNDTLKLNLDKNMIYTIAACHDLGKYINSDIHEKIAAQTFYEDNNMKTFFNEKERLIIKEAIEDHRSSKEDVPRTSYGKLISSADRNTRIEIVFIRSFFVAKVKMPEYNIEDYLDYTLRRLSKRYGEENPENMFYEDETYRVFLKDMRNLLKDEERFKDMYCKVNHIESRSHSVAEEPGEILYTKSLIRK